MMLSRNPGHRVLGSRVAVPAGDFYAAATVQAMRTDRTGNEFVTVKFDDNNKGECPSSEVVGNGFKTIHDIKLHRSQKVYTTHNGREVVGCVEEHHNGYVTVNLLNSNESISKREEDVRLIESRYSPRLQDHVLDPDYRRIASVNASPSHGKKRPVSESIEVPKQGRARKWSYEPTMDELMAAMVLSNLSNSPHFRQPRSPTVKKGSSPHSLGSSGVGSWGQDAQMSPMKGESMSQPVGAFAPRNMGTPPERTQSVIQHTQSIEHSPSSIADPIEVDTSTDMDTSGPTDGISDFKSVGGVVPPGHSTPAPFRTGSPGIQFQPAQASSPPQNPAFLAKQGLKLESVKEEPNGKEESLVDVGYALPRFYYIPSLMPSVGTRPEFMVHLQPSGTPPPPLAAADEQQYRELTQSPRQRQSDFGVGTSSNAAMYVGSPPPAIYIPVVGSPMNSNLSFGSSAPPAPSPLAVAAQMDLCSTPPRQTTTLGGNSHPIGMPLMNKQAQPINIPGIKAFSWHSSGVPQSQFPPKLSHVMQRQHMHRASSPKSPFSMSPKAPPPGRKIRGDGRKCRKIYGMENRDMWCTACRWKKACQRFPD